MNELRYFFTALGYFTRVPVPRWVGYEPHYLSAAARYFLQFGRGIGVAAARSRHTDSPGSRLTAQTREGVPTAR